jgi:hypothetical protein
MYNAKMRSGTVRFTYICQTLVAITKNACAVMRASGYCYSPAHDMNGQQPQQNFELEILAKEAFSPSASIN